MPSVRLTEFIHLLNEAGERTICIYQVIFVFPLFQVITNITIFQNNGRKKLTTKNGCIYIFTPVFKKVFIWIDRYILLFSCTCVRVHFSLVIVQHVKNLVLMRNFLSVGFFA